MLRSENMPPESPEKNSSNKSDLPHSEESDACGDGIDPAGKSERTRDNWTGGFGAGMKGVSQKLLDQIPVELREKIVDQVRTHGPGSAAVAVNAAALKTRNLKVKFALKGLGKLLQVLDSKVSGE